MSEAKNAGSLPDAAAGAGAGSGMWMAGEGTRTGLAGGAGATAGLLVRTGTDGTGWSGLLP